MAEPIRHIKRMEISPEEIKAQNIAEILGVISDNKASIVKGIKLLATIDQTGGLDILNALAIHRKVALEKFIREINKDRYAGSLENISRLFLLIGSLKMDELNFIIEKINNGLEDAMDTDEEESTSYMKLIRSLNDPSINRSITMILNFLRGMSKE